MLDEVDSSEEVELLRKVVQQGVGLVATVQIATLSALVHHPELNPLIGCMTSGTSKDSR